MQKKTSPPQTIRALPIAMEAGLRALHADELISVSGGPQIINDGATIGIQELTSEELLGVSGGPQVQNDDVVPLG
ncbi:hypothetical protein OU995_03780 [Roseateles sp. SL47]|uniref:hypothetical protein n=1 Tax=Roseateles sp. SL47 TaxID=2995138 RepID=UPI00226DB550|nr:hypothetical protein [Roseateles sp. SL47]WAC73866.1 hypothetical protein OU995_03780 [Roseateles sp. SL47]